LALALVAVILVAGVAVYLTVVPSGISSTTRASSSNSASGPSLVVVISPSTPLVAPGQTQNYSSIEVETIASAPNGTLTLSASAPAGISLVLNETSVSLASGLQSIPFRLKAATSVLPGNYQVSVEIHSGADLAANQNFTVEVVPVLVIIQDLTFHPQNITVSKGTAVTWINLDSNIGCCDPGNHDVVFVTGANASSPVLKRLDTWSYQFGAAGGRGVLLLDPSIHESPGHGHRMTAS
jgi:plastocyanin